MDRKRDTIETAYEGLNGYISIRQNRFQNKIFTGDKKGCHIMIQGSFNQEDSKHRYVCDQQQSTKTMP